MEKCSLHKKKAYRVTNVLKLLDVCQTTILSEEITINNITNDLKRNTDYFTKVPHVKPTIQSFQNTQKNNNKAQQCLISTFWN